MFLLFLQHLLMILCTTCILLANAVECLSFADKLGTQSGSGMDTVKAFGVTRLWGRRVRGAYGWSTSQQVLLLQTFLHNGHTKELPMILGHTPTPVSSAKSTGDIALHESVRACTLALS